MLVFMKRFEMLEVRKLNPFQVNKYMHAKIQTVSGIRGEIKKVRLH